MSENLLSENAGLGDWGVSDAWTYLQKARSVDKDRFSEVHLRDNLRSRRRMTPVYGPDLYAKHFV